MPVATYTPSVALGDVDPGGWTLTGGVTMPECLQVSGDGKEISMSGSDSFAVAFADDSVIPVGATISQVKFTIRHRVDGSAGLADFYYYDPSAHGDKFYDGHNPDDSLSNTSFVLWAATFATHPNTGVAWTRSQLFGDNPTTHTNYFGAIANSGSGSYHVDLFTMEVTYTSNMTWWTHPTYGWYRSQAGSPSLDAQPTDPAPSSLGWLWDTWTTTTAPTGSGWWFSDSDYGGAATLIASGRPAQPRLYTEINAFATGSTAMLGGSPGAGCVFNNHLVYAKGGYTVGTDYPTIRVWDGTFDRQLAIVPPTSAGAVPKGVVSVLAANGTVYVSTLDSGTDSTTYTGRVFELDFESGVLSQVGAVFPTGHVPYSLAWYNGQLFCGTHRRTPSAAGRIYKFRTDFTTSTWVLDRDLTSDSVGGVTSMLSFQGTLFVGTDADAATFAKILARDYTGTYTTSDTGSGGTAVANNGFLSMVEFSSNLYVGYWNNDATAITKIRKYNGSAWSTAYTGAAGTLRPLIGFVVDDGFIFAIGGGLSLSAIVLRSTDGASWTDLTAQVTSASSFTAVPVFGVIVL